jgi:hypothetical protein
VIVLHISIAGKHFWHFLEMMTNIMAVQTPPFLVKDRVTSVFFIKSGTIG